MFSEHKPSFSDSLDATGNGEPDDLDGDQTFSSEVIGMEDGTPDSEFWRISVTHFTPWDYNWPYIAPPDAEEPASQCDPFDRNESPGKDVKVHGKHRNA